MKDLPQSETAERMALATALYDQRSAKLLVVEGDEQWFHHTSRCNIYKLIRSQVLSGSCPTPETMDALCQGNESEELIEIVATSSTYDPRPVFQCLRDLAVRRAAIRGAMKIQAMAYDGDNIEALSDAITATGREIHDGTRMIEDITSSVATEQLVKHMESVFCGQSGLSMGVQWWDELIGGLQPGSHTVLAAGPKSGKTTLATYLAMSAAIKGTRVLFVSLEMPPFTLAAKMAASMAKVHFRNIIHGPLTKEDYGRLSSSIPSVSKLPIWYESSSKTTGEAIRLSMDIHQQRNGTELCIVDHLQRVKGKGSDYERITASSTAIADASHDLGIPTITLCQLNRQSAMRGEKDHRPRSVDLKGSGAIEENADTIVLLYRPSLYDSSVASNRMEVILDRSRYGSQGASVWLEYDEQRCDYRVANEAASDFEDDISTRQIPSY